MKRRNKFVLFGFVIFVLITIFSLSAFATCEGGCSSYDYEVIKGPTCTESGLEKAVCSVCGDEWELEGDDPLGHSMNSGVVTLEATCVATGQMTYTCTRCGLTETESIAALGHSMSSGRCTVCGATDSSYETPHEHTYTEWVYFSGQSHRRTCTDPDCDFVGYMPHYDVDKDSICDACLTKYGSGTAETDPSTPEDTSEGGVCDHSGIYNVERYDTDYHYGICAQCEKFVGVAHFWVEGSCLICGYSELKEDDETEPTERPVESVDPEDTDKTPSDTMGSTGGSQSTTENEMNFKRLIGALFGLTLICGDFYLIFAVFGKKTKERKKNK